MLYWLGMSLAPLLLAWSLLAPPDVRAVADTGKAAPPKPLVQPKPAPTPPTIEKGKPAPKPKPVGEPELKRRKPPATASRRP